MSVISHAPCQSGEVSTPVHPHLAEVIELCISFDPDQSPKDNLFGEEIWMPHTAGFPLPR